MSTMMEYQTKMGLFNDDITSGSSPVVMTAENTDKVIDLASGFSAFHNNDFLEVEPNDSESDQAKALTLSKPEARITYGLSYSKKATMLFKMYDADYAVIRNFDFREEVFINFKRNLGHPNLRLLIEAQLHNNFLTTTHVAYLQETLDYLSGNIERREVSNESWSALLYHYSGDFVKAHRDIKVLLSEDKYPIIRVPVDYLISIWLTASASMSDLVWFNRLIWGNTPFGRYQ